MTDCNILQDITVSLKRSKDICCNKESLTLCSSGVAGKHHANVLKLFALKWWYGHAAGLQPNWNRPCTGRCKENMLTVAIGKSDIVSLSLASL